MRFSSALLLLLASNVFAAGGTTVRDAVSEALSNNAALLANRANIDVAAARILTARLLPNPVVALTGDHLDVLGTGFSSANGGGPGKVHLGEEYTLLAPGKRPRRIETAEQAKAVVDLSSK
ncbi:MAG: TolC family protein [Bryobacteraceae bacterium]|jgi:cobalt-zinc-cadmium efflux system outer membrane protein